MGTFVSGVILVTIGELQLRGLPPSFHIFSHNVPAHLSLSLCSYTYIEVWLEINPSWSDASKRKTKRQRHFDADGLSPARCIPIRLRFPRAHAVRTSPEKPGTRARDIRALTREQIV